MLSQNPANKQSSIYHLGYRPGLDGLRGYAVLWVMAFHYEIPFGRDGLFGVDVFFTLSGFLITILLLEEWHRMGSINLKFFYLRRIIRLYPALVVLIISLSALIPSAYILSSLFYYTNWIKAFHLQPDNILDHVWSLSVEEQYYLLWPVFLLILLKINIPLKVKILIPFILGLSSAIARIVVWNTTQDWFRVYMGTDLHSDGLLLGSGFGLLTFYGLLPNFSKIKRILLLITSLTIILALWLLIEQQLTQAFIPLFGNLGVSIGTLVVISRLVNYPSRVIQSVFQFPPLVKIGVISYGVYLWHSPIGFLVDKAELAWEPMWIVIVKFFLTFLVAGISYFLIEKPILSLKTKLVSG